MNPLEYLARDAEDSSLLLTKKALEGALDAVNHRLGAPMSEAQQAREARKERCRKIRKVIGWLMLVSSVSGFVFVRFRKDKTNQAAREEKKAQEQKDLYRKLAAVKGRQ